MRPDEATAQAEALEARFQQALDAIRAHDTDGAAELLRGILTVEPRLPEPHLELARLLCDTGQPAEGEEHAREAVRLLESGGQWTDDLDENVVQGLAWDVLGEALRLRADADEAVFGDPSEWRLLLDEAARAFRRALELDPGNDHAREWAERLTSVLSA